MGRFLRVCNVASWVDYRIMTRCAQAKLAGHMRPVKVFMSISEAMFLLDLRGLGDVIFRANQFVITVVCLLTLTVSSLVYAELATTPNSEIPRALLNSLDEEAVRLSGSDILLTFKNVRDDAEVQNVAGTRAVNYWYANGRFISRWRNVNDAGEVGGVWRVIDDQRCTTIIIETPKYSGKEQCGKIFRQGEKYLSLNPDGSIHGVHSLTPLLKSMD